MRCKKYAAVIIVLLIALLIVVTSAAVPDKEKGMISVASTDNPFSSIHSARYTHMQDTALNTRRIELHDFQLKAENSALALYVNEENAALRVLNKKSGYIWGAISDEEAAEMNDLWLAFANSILSIEYLDDNGNLRKAGASDEEASTIFTYKNNMITADISFEALGIALTAKIELLNDGIMFSVDDKSIKENGEFFIANLYFMPFLGAVRETDIPGYILVPDGPGALIRYKKSAEYLSGYSARVYGFDYAIDNLYEINDLNSERPNDFSKEEAAITVPVYGIVHGVKQNALFGMIENGAEYASIHATPAGISTDYNWAGTAFIYRQLYQQPITKSGAGIQMVQKKRNQINPSLKITFLNGEKADYIGMAAEYRRYLMEKGMLSSADNSSAPYIALDFIMQDIKKGFFQSGSKTLTTVDFLENVVERLSKKGVSDIRLTLLGWEKGGLNGALKCKAYTSAAFGSFEKLNGLKKKLANRLSLYKEPFSAKEPQLAEGKDAGISLSQSPIKIVAEDKNIYLGDTWFVKYKKALETLRKQYDIFDKNGLGTPVVGGGNYLYGEYLSSGFLSRSEAKKLAVDVFASLSAEQRLTVFSPNDYLFRYTGEYRNMPMTSSQYIYEDDTVPFLPAVLSGHIFLYAPYANESFYAVENLLKCIEYNCYPSFRLIEMEDRSLKKTAITAVGSMRYKNWENRIADTYQQVIRVLENVRGKEMTAHTVLKDGVVRVDYSTGSVIVNYQNKIYASGSLSVPAQSAVYIESGKAE